MLLIYTAAIALLLVPVQASSTGIVRALGCSDGTAVPSPEYYPGLVSDCEALLLAKPTLEGSGPVMLDWISTTDIRSWRGITVTGTPPRVTAVNCRRLRLEGTVPTQLGDLSNLAELNLAANDLKGPVPPQLGNLSNLRALDLHANELSGLIPPQLRNLSNLKQLYLDFNKLTGPIPAQFGNLSSLKTLSLVHNDLSGPIPPQLANFPDLMWLDLSDNKLSEQIPPQLANLPDLVSLKLSSNELRGPIPPQLGDSPNLAELVLHSNELSGPIPAELANLSNLMSLWLANNELSGPIPAWLGDLSDLYHLGLSNNELSGPIPPQLEYLTSLRILRLANNDLSGCAPIILRDISDNDLANATIPFCDAFPGEPQDLSVTPAGDEITLAWTAPEPSGWLILGYQYQQSEDNGAFSAWVDIPDSTEGAANEGSTTVTGLTLGVKYSYRIRAINGAGAGDPSAKVSVIATHPPVYDDGDTVSRSADENAVVIMGIGGPGSDPIGYSDLCFNATFDGNGNSIVNLFIDQDRPYVVGLFGATGTDCVVTQLTLLDAQITSVNWVGPLVGLNSGTVTRDSAPGEVLGPDYVGGLVGRNDSTLPNSYSTANVSGRASGAGWLARTTGRLSPSTSNVASPVSYGWGVWSVSTRDILEPALYGGPDSGTDRVGGLVGRNETGTSLVSYWDSDTSYNSSSAGGTG